MSDALKYLAQASHTGRLGVEELAALMEHAPRFVRMLCDGLGTTPQMLHALAKMDELTVSVIEQGMR